MPVPEMVFLNTRFGMGLDLLVDPGKELIGEPLSRLAIAGGIVSRRLQAVVLEPGLNQGDGVGTGFVLFEDLRDPSPEHSHLGETPFANIRGDLKEPLGRKNIVEENAQIGDGATERGDTLTTEDLQLTTALRTLKFRRETRQKWGQFFHTLPNL